MPRAKLQVLSGIVTDNYAIFEHSTTNRILLVPTSFNTLYTSTYSDSHMHLLTLVYGGHVSLTPSPRVLIMHTFLFQASFAKATRRSTPAQATEGHVSVDAYCPILVLYMYVCNYGVRVLCGSYSTDVPEKETKIP